MTFQALKERLAWRGLEYRIAPTATRLPYMLGGLTFFGILLLVVTGVLLDQLYSPTPVGAHDSVVYIMTRVPFGGWLRALHYWAATVVLISVVAHLAWVFRRRSYVRPRELTWWSGVTMLLVLLALVFTGTVLRSDQEGGEALAHAIAGARLVGDLGAILAPDFVRSTTLLTRMHNAHVSLLPIALLALIGLHFWLIRYLGIHTDEPKTRIFTEHLRRLTGLGLLVAASIGTLALLFPPGLGYPAVEGVEMTKPFWPFLWIYAAENTMGLWGMIIAPAVLFGLLYLVPLVDRPHGDDSGRPRWMIALAMLVGGLYLAALVYGWLAPQMQHIGM